MPITVHTLLAALLINLRVADLSSIDSCHVGTPVSASSLAHLRNDLLGERRSVTKMAAKQDVFDQRARDASEVMHTIPSSSFPPNSSGAIISDSSGTSGSSSSSNSSSSSSGRNSSSTTNKSSNTSRGSTHSGTQESSSGNSIKSRNHKDVASVTGVKINDVSDAPAFASALILNCVTVLLCMSIFMYLRHQYPLIYSNNVRTGDAPTGGLGESPIEAAANLDATWGWWRASMGTPTQHVADSVGLDAAMLIEFSNLCKKLSTIIGIPMVLVIGPMNCMFGGQVAWKRGDYLSVLSVNNVEKGSWLHWVHAFVVWYVVIALKMSLFSAQSDFIKRRGKWLHEMADERANTLLVTAIPDDHRSDVELARFFGEIFGHSNIASAHVVKCTKDLLPILAEREGLKHANLSAANPSGPQNRRFSFNGLAAQALQIEMRISEEIRRIKEASLQMRGVNTHCGFVTFTQRMHAEMANRQVYSVDSGSWQVEMAPDPSDIRWTDLEKTPAEIELSDVLGVAAIVGVFFAYVPCVLGISAFCMSLSWGPLWKAMGPSLLLSVMVGFLPTILHLISKTFFTSRTNTDAQRYLQRSYFCFQLVFVVLVTAVSDSLSKFVVAVITNPLSLPVILGEEMPPATHFYMNYLAMQWAAKAIVLLRYPVLFKFKGFMVAYDEEEARRLSEPEDQDYYGIGARSTHLTTVMVITIVFGTISPLLYVLCFVSFWISRLVHGYLIPFAETQKADLGGAFWVEQLHHIFVGKVVYCIFMIGVLWNRTDTSGIFDPAFIVSLALVYVLWSWLHFCTDFQWQNLPLCEVLGTEPVKKKFKGSYVQPDLTDVRASRRKSIFW
eukprot:TRINITY_DN15900_c0_g1_i1.p1 TRINITY_DN15900_c0_g1~~TRINITY_DN15900_c0_g1_i1.p1  ORF type:complete len:840 (+),score=107.38 TRINITY_DN15900_c0_g1_i1:159-2678(+)